MAWVMQHREKTIHKSYKLNGPSVRVSHSMTPREGIGRKMTCLLERSDEKNTLHCIALVSIARGSETVAPTFRWVGFLLGIFMPKDGP